MQVKKDEIFEKIVQAAIDEFTENSYAGASLNRIAKAAGLSRGAIYTYFKNKEDLFSYLCGDAIALIKNHFTIDKRYFDYKLSKEAMRQSFKVFAKYVRKKQISFRLLLFCSGGSKYENFKDEIISMYSRAFPIWALGINDYDKSYKTLPNDMFINSIAKLFISYLEEILLHSPSEEEYIEYAGKLADFGYAGILSFKQDLIRLDIE